VVYVQYVEEPSTGSRLKTYVALGAAMTIGMTAVGLIFRAIGLEPEEVAQGDAALHAAWADVVADSMREVPPPVLPVTPLA